MPSELAAEPMNGPENVSRLPRVSVVIPCRNERRHIGRCLQSIFGGSYPAELLEVLVVDGMSDDGTRELLSEAAGRFPGLVVIDNEKKTTPNAFNLGVKRATGELVMIMSAHATYHPEAISRAVGHSRRSGAENVGGIWEIQPRDEGVIAQSIAEALSHPFGVGGAHYRTIRSGEPRWVDTAAYGCYRREVFQKVGFFNPELTRGQDMEFNLRLLRAGGRTLLAPDVRVTYFARSDLTGYLVHNFRNGQWAVLPFAFSPIVPVAPRHLIPMLFAGCLAAGIIAARTAPGGVWVLAAVAVPYLAAALAASCHVASRRRDLRFLFTMPIAFSFLHLPYGFGSLVGAIQAAALIVRRGGRQARDSR